MQLSKMYPLNTDTWEQRANKVLSHFNYTAPDEIDMYEICWRYGMRIKPLDKCFFDGDIPNGAKALSIPTQGRRGLIYLKENLDPIEKKLLLAEEFCHLYAHAKNQLNDTIHEINKTENQAKRMAAYLLMPQVYLDKVYSIAEDHAVMLTEMADYFLVSEEFAQYRLELIFNRKVDALGFVKGQLGTFEWFE